MNAGRFRSPKIIAKTIQQTVEYATDSSILTPLKRNARTGITEVVKMSIKTLKSFIAETHVAAPIVRAVVRQMGGWGAFKESASDVARHGASGGFSGFCYYSDTVPFAKRIKAELLELCSDEAREFDKDGAASFIASFNCVSLNADEVAQALYNRGDDNQTEVFNALAWYALETVARAYDDLSA